MLNLNNINKRQTGVTEYTDSKSNVHKVKHSVILSDIGKRELEERIAGELYNIFKNHSK